MQPESARSNISTSLVPVVAGKATQRSLPCSLASKTGRQRAATHSQQRIGNRLVQLTAPRSTFSSKLKRAFKKAISSLIIVVLSFASFSPLSAASDGYELPHIGDPSGALFTPQQEQELGEQIVQQLRSRGLILQDASVTSYIEDLGYKLVAQSDWASDGFEFFVVNSTAINAFALPGGFIGINLGLISASGDESELAGVMAHEIVHVTQKHILRGAEKSARSSALTTAALVLGLLLSGGDPTAIQAIIGASLSVDVQNQLNFTRAHELEADRIGIRLLNRAGFNPYGMARFFERLWQRSRLSENSVPEILRTHPLYSTRVNEALSRAAQISDGRVVADSDRFRLVQARIEVLTDRDVPDLVNRYRAQLKLARSDRDRNDSRYRLALALHESGREREAAKLFRNLMTGEETRIEYRVALAETLMAAKQDEEALTVYNRGIKLFPNNRELNTSYARSLVEIGKPAEALQLLRSAIAYDRSEYPVYYRLLARAATESEDAALGHYYMGEYLRLSGRLFSAVRQLQLAVDSSQLPPSQQLRAKARLQEIKSDLPKQQQRQLEKPPKS